MCGLGWWCVVGVWCVLLLIGEVKFSLNLISSIGMRQDLANGRRTTIQKKRHVIFIKIEQKKPIHTKNLMLVDQ